MLEAKHPYIQSSNKIFFDADKKKEKLVIISDLAEFDLKRFIASYKDEEKLVPEEIVVRFAYQMALALAYLH